MLRAVICKKASKDVIRNSQTIYIIASFSYTLQVIYIERIIEAQRSSGRVWEKSNSKGLPFSVAPHFENLVCGKVR